MTSMPPGPQVPILERAKTLLLRPRTSWSITASILGVIVLLGILAALLPKARTQAVDASGKVSLPGDVTINMNALDEATKRLEYITKQMEAAGQATDQNGEDAPPTLPAITPQQLKAFLPESLPGGYARASGSASSGGAGGFAFVNAEASYTNDKANIDLSLSDFGAVGALASLGGIFGAHANEETETSYSKFGDVNGRMTVESYDKSAERGSYGVLVGNRVLVEAKGEHATMAELKAAVNVADFALIEALVTQPAERQ